MNARDEDLALKNGLLCHSLDLNELVGGVIRGTTGLRDHGHVDTQQPDVAVEPQTSRLIESWFLIKGR